MNSCCCCCCCCPFYLFYHNAVRWVEIAAKYWGKWRTSTEWQSSCSSLYIRLSSETVDPILSFSASADTNKVDGRNNQFHYCTLLLCSVHSISTLLQLPTSISMCLMCLCGQLKQHAHSLSLSLCAAHIIYTLRNLVSESDCLQPCL